MNKKIVLAYIIGFISAISITIFANILYSAKDIEYTSSNEEWQVTNVEDAINSLYGSNNELKNQLQLANSKITDLTKMDKNEVLYDTTVADQKNVFYTKSYTFTQNDVNNKYRMLIVILLSSGGGYLAWTAIEDRIPNVFSSFAIGTPTIVTLVSNKYNIYTEGKMYFVNPPAAGTTFQLILEAHVDLL